MLGQAPHLLLGPRHLRNVTRINTASMSKLVEGPQYPLPMMIPGQMPVRHAEDVARGLGLPLESEAELTEAVKSWLEIDNPIEFSTRLVRGLRALLPRDYGRRSEAYSRCKSLWKSRPHRSIAGEAVIQKSLTPSGPGWEQMDGTDGWRKAVPGGWRYFFTPAPRDPQISAELRRLHQPMREVHGAPELVWCCEETGNDLGPIPQRDALSKGQTHKYLRRIPTGKARPRWRYIYKLPGKERLVSDEHLVEGAKFRVAHAGAEGHFEVVHHDKDKGIVHVRHDESGKHAHIRVRDLRRMLESYHRNRGTPGAGERTHAEPAAKLPRVGMHEVGEWSAIEAFRSTPEELEDIARERQGEGRDWGVIQQPGGWALVSREREQAGDQRVVRGAKTQVFIRDSSGQGITELPAHWQLMEADDLVASHDPMTFDPHPSYPKGVQERRYHQVHGEQLKVDRIARQMQPAMILNTNPDAINGTPVLTQDKVVLGGNGRSMAMQRAYRMYPEAAARLRSYLQHNARGFGLTAAQVGRMKNPVLVRVVETAGDTEELHRLGRRMNEALTQGLDPRSEEVSIGKAYVNKDVVAALTSQMTEDQTLTSYLTSMDSADFVGALERAGVIDEYNRDQYVIKDGGSKGLLNEDGRNRVERVLAARMLPDASVLDRMMPSHRATIASSTPYLLMAEDAGWDIKDSLMRAVRSEIDMRERRFRGAPAASEKEDHELRRYLSQGEMEATGSSPQQEVNKDPTAMLLLEILRRHGDKTRVLPLGFRGLAMRAKQSKYDSGSFAMMREEAAETPETALSKEFGIGGVQKESKVKQRQEQSELFPGAGGGGQAGLFAASMSDEVMDLMKAVEDDNRLMNRVVWLTEMLVDSQVQPATAAGRPAKVDGAKITKQVMEDVKQAIKNDQALAYDFGRHPVTKEIVQGLVESFVRMHGGGMSKSAVGDMARLLGRRRPRRIVLSAVDDELRKAEQLSLFGGGGAKWPPAGGWEAIPKGKHGGVRRRRAKGGYEYKYPDENATRLHPKEDEPPEVHAEHSEHLNRQIVQAEKEHEQKVAQAVERPGESRVARERQRDASAAAYQRLSDLKAAKERADERVRHAEAAVAHADSYYTPEGEVGGIRSRSAKVKEQIFDRTTRTAKEHVEAVQQQRALTAAIQDIESGAAERRRDLKAKVDLAAVRLFAALKPGDRVDVGGNDPVTVAKKNRLSIETEGGAKWTISEITGVHDKELVRDLLETVEKEGAGQDVASAKPGRLADVPAKNPEGWPDTGQVTAAQEVVTSALKNNGFDVTWTTDTGHMQISRGGRRVLYDLKVQHINDKGQVSYEGTPQYVATVRVPTGKKDASGLDQYDKHERVVSTIDDVVRFAQSETQPPSDAQFKDLPDDPYGGRVRTGVRPELVYYEYDKDAFAGKPPTADLYAKMQAAMRLESQIEGMQVAHAEMGKHPPATHPIVEAEKREAAKVGITPENYQRYATMGSAFLLHLYDRGYAGSMLGLSHDDALRAMQGVNLRETLTKPEPPKETPPAAPQETTTGHAVPSGGRPFWESLREGDTFEVPRKTMGGRESVDKWKVVRVLGQGRLEVRRSPGRTTFEAHLTDEGAFTYKAPFGWAWASPSEVPRPVTAKTPEAPKAMGPGGHPFHAQLADQYKQIEQAMETRGIHGPKADAVKRKVHDALVTASHLKPGEDAGTEYRGPMMEARRALREAVEYIRGRVKAAKAPERKAAAEAAVAAHRAPVRSEDTPVGDLPRPEAPEHVSSKPQAAELWEHIRNRRIVDSYTIPDYPIGRGYRGQLKVWVEYKPASGWRVMTQTTDRAGRWNKPHGGTYYHHPVYVVEPQGDERGVLLSLDPSRGAHLSQVRGQQVMGWTQPQYTYGSTEREASERDTLQTVTAFRDLVDQRRVSAKVEADTSKDLQQRNLEHLATQVDSAKRQYQQILREAEHRLRVVQSTADPDRLGSIKRRSYDASRRMLSEWGINPDTGERTGGGKLVKIERFLERHGEKAQAPEHEAAQVKTGAERVVELQRLQDAKPAPRLTPHQRHLGQFNTPHPVAYQMAEKVGVNGLSVMDPTAGEGRLLKYASELGATSAVGYEVDQTLARYAEKVGVRHGNFLDVPRETKADVLLMNPPFTTGGPDTAAIVGKAIRDHWTRRGKAAIILPAGPSGDRIIAPYLNMVSHKEDLDEKAFQKEGTNVRSRLYILDPTLAKSMNLVLLPDFYKAFPVGTVRQWASGQYKKVDENRWEPVGSGRQGEAKPKPKGKTGKPEKPLEPQEHGLRLPVKQLPNPKVGRELSQKLSQSVKGSPRQSSKSFEEIYSGATEANRELQKLTYDVAQATGGKPAFPPSVLSGFQSPDGFEAAKRMAETVKGKGVPVAIDEKRREVLIFEPRAAAAVARELHNQRHPCHNTNGLKGKERAQKKAETTLGEDGKPDPSRLLDIARSTVEFDSIDGLYQALEAITKQVKVVRFKDRFQSPMPGGYRDILMNIQMSNGHVAELQLHVGEILKIKMGEGHKLYEVAREISENVEKEGRVYKRQEAEKIAQAMLKQQKLYDAAYKKALKKKAA